MTIPQLLRRTWELSLTRPALAAFAVLLVLSLAGVFGPYYFLAGMVGESLVSYPVFSLALGVIRWVAGFAIIIVLSRRLLRDGGANHPPRWLRCIALMLICSFAMVFSPRLSLR